MAMAAAVCLAAVLATTSCSDSPATGGDSPSAASGIVNFEGKDTSGMAGIEASAGHTVVFGQTVIKNTGSEPAVVTSTSLVGDVKPEAAEVVDRRVLDLRTPHDLVGAAPWPYQDYPKVTVPAAGFVVAAGAEASLLFVITVHQDGYWAWPKARITYTVGGRAFTDTSTYGFEVCPPRCQDPHWGG